MSRSEDDFESQDGSEEIDPVVRELQLEIIRLEAQLDQLTASVRERAEESALIQARLAALEARIARLESGRRRDEKLVVVFFLLSIASLGLSIYTYLSA